MSNTQKPKGRKPKQVPFIKKEVVEKVEEINLVPKNTTSEEIYPVSSETTLNPSFIKPNTIEVVFKKIEGNPVAVYFTIDEKGYVGYDDATKIKIQTAIINSLKEGKDYIFNKSSAMKFLKEIEEKTKELKAEEHKLMLQKAQTNNDKEKLEKIPGFLRNIFGAK